MMRTVLSKYGVSFKREMLYKMPHKVRDVVKLHSRDRNPYIIVDRKKIELPEDTYIANVKTAQGNLPTFYDNNFNAFYHATPVSRVLRESFFIEFDENMYYVVNQDNILKEPESPLYDQTSASAILEPILNESLKELEEHETIQRGALINLIVKNVMDHSLDIKLEKQILKELLKIVDKKVAQFDEEIRQAELKLQKKANKKVKWFTNFLIAELALLHYFIYFNLSWDIMEPITVIIMNIDIMVAYWFFIIKGKNFSPTAWKDQIFVEKKYRHLLNSGVDVQKYQEYMQIRGDLKNRLKLLTRNPLAFMSACEEPIEIISNRIPE